MTSKDVELLSSTKSLFAELVAAEFEAHRTGVRTVRGPRRAAVRAVQHAGADAFFREQLSAIQAQGHWAEQVLFRDTGLALRFVAVPGQQGVLGTDGNISVMSVETERNGAITIYFDAGGVPLDLTETRRFAATEFNRAALVDAYSDFVSSAVQKALATT